MIKAVSFYTNGFYFRHALKLSESLVKHGVTYEILKQDAESWHDAVSRKPEFILKSLKATNAEGLLWTDADSILERPIPDIAPCDVGLVKWKRSPHHEEEILTGTMYFRNSEPVQALLEDWIDATPKYRHTNTPEQDSLKEVIQAYQSILNIQYLPVEWCFIFDDHREMYPDAKAIFTHYQASRKFREMENGKGVEEQHEAGEVQDEAPMPQVQGEGLGMVLPDHNAAQEWRALKRRGRR